MDAADRNRLRANHLELIRNLNPEDITAYLYQEAVLREEDIERIMAPDTRTKRVETFLSILRLKSGNWLNKFLEALKDSGYDELAEKIEQDEVSAEDALQGAVGGVEVSDTETAFSLKEMLREQSEFIREMREELEELRLNAKDGDKLSEIVSPELEKEQSRADKLLDYTHLVPQKLEDTAELSEEEDNFKVIKEHTPVKDERAAGKTKMLKSPSKVLLKCFPIKSSHSQNDDSDDETNKESKADVGLKSFSYGPQASNDKKTRIIKCVIVGDGSIGKSCLCLSYLTGKFPTEYVPTVFEEYMAQLQVKSGSDIMDVSVEFLDTGGQEDYDGLRPLAYPDTDVFILLFSVDCPDSVANILEKWFPEVQKHCPKIPVVLVGTKVDLVNNKDTHDRLKQERLKMVTKRQADSLAKKIKAAGGRAIFVSAITGNGVSDLMNFMVVTALKSNGTIPKRGKKGK